MRRAAAAFLAFLALGGCTREEARARLQDDIHADAIDIIHARFPCHSPDLHFFGYRFRVIEKGMATATFAGICRRDNGRGASSRGRASPASTLATSVCRMTTPRTSRRRPSPSLPSSLAQLIRQAYWPSSPIGSRRLGSFCQKPILVVNFALGSQSLCKPPERARVRLVRAAT